MRSYYSHRFVDYVTLMHVPRPSMELDPIQLHERMMKIVAETMGVPEHFTKPASTKPTPTQLLLRDKEDALIGAAPACVEPQPKLE